MQFAVFLVCLVLPVLSVFLLRKPITQLLQNAGSKVSVPLISVFILLLPFGLTIFYDTVDFRDTIRNRPVDSYSDLAIIQRIDRIERAVGTLAPIDQDRFDEAISFIRGWTFGVLEIQENINYPVFVFLGLMTGLWISLVFIEAILHYSKTRMETEKINTEATLLGFKRTLRFINTIAQEKRIRLIENQDRPTRGPGKKNLTLSAVCQTVLNPDKQIHKITEEVLQVFHKSPKIDGGAALRAGIYVPNKDQTALVLLDSCDSHNNHGCMKSIVGKYTDHFKLDVTRQSLAVRLYFGETDPENYVILSNFQELEASPFFEYFDDEQKKRVRSLVGIRLIITKPSKYLRVPGVIVLDSDTDDYFVPKDDCLIVPLQPEISLRLEIELRKKDYFSRLCRGGR